ncbi:collagen alpha-1(I) chain-like [Ovis aries]|uniref:collagen alpha-1(I) chain-like n=1 Tax=Ovis aries TaxID=9940 RepID=UPI001C2EF7F6|nr:collagen alpha-1(I) chain-like [Ovis aries]
MGRRRHGGVRSARGYLESLSRRRRPGRGREEADRVRKPGGRGGRKGARRAGRPDRPGPARGEDARPRDAPRVREGRGAPPPPRGRHEGGLRREEEGGGPPSFLPLSTPPGPGHYDGDGRRAPSASIRPPTPERGGGGRAARTRRPARGGARPDPSRARASASGGGALVQHATTAAAAAATRATDRAAAGPGSEAHRGTRPRGAADGEGTEADGRTERGTDGVRPRGADTTQPVAEGRSRGTTRDDDGLAPLPRGARAHRHRHPQSRSRPGENTLPPHTGGPRPTALTRAGLPPRPLAQGFRGHCSARGRHRPGRGRGRHPRTPARDPTATRTRGRSRDAWGAGRPRPSPERGPRPGPAATAGEPSTRLPPSIRDGSVFPSEAEPRGATSRGRRSSEAARTVTARRHQLRPRRRGRARRAPPHHQLAGPGSRGRPGVAPDTAPLPQGSHHGGRPHAHGPPPAGRPAGPAGPSPTRGGGAGRGRQRAAHGPTAGLAHLTPSPPTESGEFCSAHVLWQSPRWPLRTREGQRLGAPVPQGSSRIAREGVLTEGAPSSPDRLTFGPTEALRQPPGLSWAGGVCGLIRQGLHDEGNRHASPYRLDPPKREPLGTHTPPWRGPKGDTGLRETTPPLGLRHLRDDLERSRGTTEGHTRHAHTPAWGAQRGGGGTALPATGRAARRAHAEKAKREQSAASEDQRRPLTPRGKGQQETEDQGRRPHTQPLPSSPSLMGSGGEDKRGAPADRPRRADTLTGNARPRLARLRLGPGEHDHTTSIRGAKARAANDPKRRTPDTEPTGRGSSQPPPGAHSGGEGRPG